MNFEVEAVIRILSALLFGGLIGYEREYRNMPAGFRTHILVCIGAALVMVTSEYIFFRFSGIADLDPARMGAQVISGIGFLGAGTILRDKFRVTGLTTAASLWAVACIGLAVGSGFYFIATVATLVIFATLSLLRRFEGVFTHRATKSRFSLTVRMERGREKQIRDLLERAGCIVLKISSFTNSGDKILAKYEIHCKKGSMNDRLLMETLLKEEGVTGAELD